MLIVLSDFIYLDFMFLFLLADCTIDLFKVIDAILPGVQNYWGERAAKPEIANGGVE